MRLFVRVVLTIEQRLHMTCKEFIRRASDKYDRPPSLGERFLQAIHRGICVICRIQEGRMDQLRALAREIARQPHEHGKARLSPETVARIRAAMIRTPRG